MREMQRERDSDFDGHSGLAGKSRDKNMGLAEGCAWEENFCAAFATTVSEQTCDSISEDIVASVDSSRLTTEDVVTIGILCRAAKGAMLRKAHREAETPPEKSLLFSRGSPLCRELRAGLASFAFTSGCLSGFKGILRCFPCKLS